MKRVTLALLVLLLAVFNLKAGEDEEAIKKAIIMAYVEAIHNLKNVDSIEKGFHPGFELLGLRDGELTKYPIQAWKESTEKRAEEHPEGAEKKTVARFPLIDITGDAAIAKVELYRQDTLVYSDYISLYRFEDGWKIVSKIYQKH